MRAAGFVLVGGSSRRMGRDKALLPADSGYLVQEVAGKVATAAGNVTLVGRPQSYRTLGFDCIPDRRPGLGPMAGIEAALESRRGDFNLIVACDMPGIDIGRLSALLERSKDTGALCTVLRDEAGSIHPLCAVYRTGCLPRVQQALDSGRLALLALIQELDGEIVDISGTVWNINTPQDWAAWQEHRSA